MDRASPSESEIAAEVSGVLAPRAGKVSEDIYHLIMREIPQLRGEKHFSRCWEASVGENVATLLHVLQHGIDLANVHAPAAAEEYARRLAQRGVPVAVGGVAEADAELPEGVVPNPHVEQQPGPVELLHPHLTERVPGARPNPGDSVQ